jgi:hypothetical protein
VVKDLNKDGRLDIIFGRGHDVGLYWWEQQAPRPDGTTVWKKTRHRRVAGRRPRACAGRPRRRRRGGADRRQVHLGPQRRRSRRAATAGHLLLQLGPKAATFTRHTIADKGENIALGRQYDVVDLNGTAVPNLTAPQQAGAVGC